MLVFRYAKWLMLLIMTLELIAEKHPRLVLVEQTSTEDCTLTI